MNSVCPQCGLDYSGTRWLRSHRCLGTASPSTNDLLIYLGAVEDERGCLLSTRNFKALGYKSRYRALPSPARRVIGEYYTHRAMYKLASGQSVPENLDVGHECGRNFENAACVNPEHLRACTRKENHAHMDPATRSMISSAGGIASPTKLQPGHVPWNKEMRH